MSKQSGLGDNFYFQGYDLSGDVGALSRIGGGPELLEVTGIDKTAFERITGKKSGGMEFSTFFNDDAVGDSAHTALKGLPYTDVIGTYCRGTALGGVSAVCISKQIGYDFTRGNDGGLGANVSLQSNGFGIEWGVQGTAGKRTDTTATSPATGIDTLASASFGGQAYLQVFSLTGTSVTVAIEDSANNSAFSSVAGFAFVAASAKGAQRIQLGSTATLRRYLRVVTTGTFTSAIFQVTIVKNEAAVSF